jgi:hypothetical protein
MLRKQHDANYLALPRERQVFIAFATKVQVCRGASNPDGHCDSLPSETRIVLLTTVSWRIAEYRDEIGREMRRSNPW